MYKAILFSIDGDYVIDCKESESIDSVWDQVNDFGSKWFFYPIVCVIPDNNTQVQQNRLVSVPDYPPELFTDFTGKSVATFQKYLKENTEEIVHILQAYWS